MAPLVLDLVGRSIQEGERLLLLRSPVVQERFSEETVARSRPLHSLLSTLHSPLFTPLSYRPRSPLPRDTRSNTEMMSSTVMAEQVSKLDDMIGQMSQIDVTLLLDTDEDGKSTANQAKLEYYFGVLGVGSLLNTPLSEPWTAADYRAVVVAIQNITETYNRPPVIWGLDSVHGANYIHGAVMTPQPINLAATFNSTTSYTAGIIASRDTRAAGITWLFSPLLGLSLEPKW